MKTLRRLLMLLTLWLSATVAIAQGGPIVLMGIDAEDGAPNGHGPNTVYQAVAQNILSNVSKPGAAGILVIGGVPGGQINIFWNTLAAGIGEPVTYAQGAAAISTANFGPYKLIAVASDEFNTFQGLTDAENDALALRASDVASHVNSGGGLFGFSNCALTNRYGYLGGLGAFTCATVGESDISPTAEGAAVGITNALDVCCWHDAYTAFPTFLQMLATYPSGTVAAIGGVQVVIPGFVLTPGSASNLIGTPHTVTINVTQTTGGASTPVAGVTVNVNVTGIHTSSGTCVTDANGMCSFTYTGTHVGTDTITATGVFGGRQHQATATKTWTAPPSVAVPFDIKPTSCRNPMNTNAEYSERSVVPAAILGTNRFDVTTIDPASVKLEGVRALRWNIEDVAAPFEPYIGKQKATDCTTAGPDRYRDLTLKFNGQQLINALGGQGALQDGQVIVMKVTGLLRDGTSINGEDVVVILKKGK